MPPMTAKAQSRNRILQVHRREAAIEIPGGQEPAGATECTWLFAGSPDCWHGHLLNSGRRIHLDPAERDEGWVQTIRPDPFEDQGTGFAFEPHIKKILILGVCGIVVRGRRGG